MAQGDDYTRTHIKCMKVKLAVTPSAWLLPKPLYQRLEEKLQAVCVCVLGLHWGHIPTGADWDCSWMDDGFQAVFTCPPVVSSQPGRYSLLVSIISAGHFSL